MVQQASPSGLLLGARCTTDYGASKDKGTLVFEGVITTLQDGVVCCSYVRRFACDFVQSLYQCDQP